ncbi:UNVERIFIED_CONTAM: hypothetical protein H355_001056 [Colinus virginianus]|nr:hypothetical protein H355_001056 [Colinus virginianus]
MARVGATVDKPELRAATASQPEPSRAAAMSSVVSYESLVHAVSGAVGSMTAMTVFFPLDTARLRLQDAFHQIIRDEGALALWNGTFPSLLLVFNPAIQFMFYEGFKRKLLKKQTQFGRHRLNPENRTLGSLKNVLYLLRERVRRFGLMGLYKGLEAKLLQTVLTAALMFLVYEKLTAATFRVMGLKHSRRH